jgi:uncharacterized protein YjbJ (UPF0337 family)
MTAQHKAVRRTGGKVASKERCDAILSQEEIHMEGTADDMKGRAKEAIGDLTDDDDLKREGKTDRASGAIKDKVEDAKDWVEDKVDDVKDRMKRD